MREKGNILIILAVVVALAVGSVIYFQLNSTQNSPSLRNSYIQSSPSSIPASSNNAGQMKIYQSKTLKFRLNLPNEYQVEDKLGSVTISSDRGEIFIDRNGTNFENLEDYVIDLEDKNKYPLTSKKNLIINNLEAITGLGKNERIFFIYKEHFVYTISTTSKSLFNDLDQIAQSFRYTP